MVPFWPFRKSGNAIFSLCAGILVASCASTPLKVESPTEMPFIDKLSEWKAPSRLKGANIWQRRVVRGITPSYSLQNLQRLRRLGANYVHLSIPGIFHEEPPYAVDPVAVHNLDSLIETAAQADLRVVIAFRTGPGRHEESFQAAQTKKPDALWSNDAAKAAWVAMWKTAAERYSARAHVIGLELMVEPNPEDSRAEAAVWAALSEGLVKQVRTVDPHIPILLSPTGYASIDHLDKLPELPPGTVLSVHFYEPYGFTHAEKDPPSPLSAEEIRRRVAKVERFAKLHQVPFAVTEYGIKRWVKGAPGYLGRMVEQFDSFGVAHAVWLWETDEKLNYDDFNFRFGEKKTAKRETPNNALLKVLRSAWSRQSSK